MGTNVQLKGSHPSQPWLVIEGDPAQIVHQIGEVFPHLIQGETSPAELPELVALAASEWSTRLGAGMSAVAAQPSGVQAVQQGLGGQVVAQQATPPPPVQQVSSPVPPVSAPPAPAAPAAGAVESDRWGNEYYHDDPRAPLTPDGVKAVRKTGKSSRDGKPYNQWLHPTHPSIPSAYAAGYRDKGVWTSFNPRV